MTTRNVRIKTGTEGGAHIRCNHGARRRRPQTKDEKTERRNATFGGESKKKDIMSIPDRKRKKSEATSVKQGPIRGETRFHIQTREGGKLGRREGKRGKKTSFFWPRRVQGGGRTIMSLRKDDRRGPTV